MTRTLLTVIFLNLFSQTADAKNINLVCKEIETEEVTNLILVSDKNLAIWNTLSPTKYIGTGRQFAWTTTNSGNGYVDFISFILDKNNLQLKLSILSSSDSVKDNYYSRYQCIAPLN